MSFPPPIYENRAHISPFYDALLQLTRVSTPSMNCQEVEELLLIALYLFIYIYILFFTKRLLKHIIHTLWRQ